MTQLRPAPGAVWWSWITSRALAALPEGRPLPEQVWRNRHRGIVTLLWLHAAAILAYGMVMLRQPVHVLAEVAGVVLAALLASWPRLGRELRTMVASGGLITCSGLLVHYSGGLIEMHFHFFVMVAVVTLYQAWSPYLVAIMFVAIHHGVVGVLDPQSVYTHRDAWLHPWKWAGIHAAFVLAASVVGLITWRLNEALRIQSELILDSAGEGICGLDSQGDIAFVNKAATDLLGYRESELVGQSWHEVVHPWEKNRLECPLASCLAEGDKRSATELFVTKSGAKLPVDYVSIPIRRRNGTTSAVLTFRDVSARVRAEGEIRALNSNLEQRVRDRTEELQLANEAVGRERTTLAAVMGGMTDGLLLIDGGSSIRYANRRAAVLLGVESLQAVGTMEALFEQLGDSLLEPNAMRLSWARAIENPREFGIFELALTTPERRNLELHFFSVDRANDGEQSVGVVLRDVTEERDLARTKDQLLAVVSHEVRTPLASLLGFTELLLERELSTSQRQLYLTTMLQDGQRLGTLINNFLDLQRRESGQLGIEPAALDARELLGQVVASFGGDVQDSAVLDVAPALPPVWADSGAIRQVLGNLISNARKYSSAGGEIRLAAREVDGMVELSVRDYGLGLPAEALPKLFEKFYRVDNSDRRTIQGTGLGLAICRKIVEAHGGSIWAESAGEGHGCRFAFTLPVANASQSAAGQRIETRSR